MRSSSILVALALALAPGTVVALKSKEKAAAVKSDVPYVRCSVCEEAVKHLHRSIKQRKEELQDSKDTLSEYEIIGMVEGICDPASADGEWISKLDMVEDLANAKIRLVEQEEFGECGSECKTMQRACEETMEDAAVEVAEALYKGEMQRAALSSLVCRELSSACSRKTPKLPASRAPGPAFVPMDPKEREMQQMMQSMQGMEGMPGMSMYSRDDLLEQYGLGGEDDYGDADGAEYDPEEFARLKEELARLQQEEGDGGSADDGSSGPGAIEDAVNAVVQGAKGLLDRAKSGFSSLIDTASRLMGGDEKEGGAQQSSSELK